MSIDLPNKADDYVKFPDLSVESGKQNGMVFHNGMFGYCLHKCGRTVDVSQPISTSNTCECKLKEIIY